MTISSYNFFLHFWHTHSPVAETRIKVQMWAEMIPPVSFYRQKLVFKSHSKEISPENQSRVNKQENEKVHLLCTTSLVHLIFWRLANFSGGTKHQKIFSEVRKVYLL